MAKKLSVTQPKPTLAGARVLVTAGPTHEYLDDVRFIGNPSTGRMGLEIGRAAYAMGARVTVVCGPTNLQPAPGVRLVPVVSAEDMLAAVEERFADCDVFIATAAVSDYRPEKRTQGKIKKRGKVMTLKLVRNPDVLLRMGKRARDDQMIVGFSLESANSLEYARGKLEKKRCDLMIVTSPANFGDAREAVRLINAQGVVAEVPPAGKAELAEYICRMVAEIRAGKQMPLIEAFGAVKALKAKRTRSDVPLDAPFATTILTRKDLKARSRKP